MTVEQYIENIDKRYRLGNATEHTFRGDLQQLLESLVPTIRATNEPKRQSCGAPDYILTKGDIPVGFIEAKDIGNKDLEGAKKTGNKEQFDRYKASLNNLIFTDYLDFHLYIDGVFITKIAIAQLTDKGINPLAENFTTFENLIKDFCSHIGQNIKSPKKLAEMMAGKARLLSDVIEKALTSDQTNHEDSTLKDQMLAFKEILIHDITPKGFADVYAQTIAYGMFAARLHDPTLPTFSRQEAAELIPKTNPFLRKLFGYIAGPDIDDRIKWIVDSLVDIFLACNVEEILKNYGKSTKMEDPIIHFYETFLSEYDPKLRKARGVWYTPAPVVNFIVRAVDDILKTEFDLPQGLADTSKTKITTPYPSRGGELVHKVQILDPATGTGTFLAEVVKHIHKKFEGQQGIWSNYVENHLLPRLNGFELLMASYAMAHLQLDLLLTETGYKKTTQSLHEPKQSQRLRVYLTNSLEESHPDTGTLFANWLSSEANEANHIKRDTPVMCIIGNPPYAVSSTNKNEWIEKLTADYKKDMNERNIQPLSDDYIKFIRFGQHFIDKNGSGVLAYISNNSFIDGIIHRQMRKSLLESFDKIYILDLHGNAKKKEVCPDGSPDQNVFDIMQGVSINIFVKTGKKFPSSRGVVPEGRGGQLGKVFHFDLQGKRDFKYEYLNENTLKSIKWSNLDYSKPNYFFVKKDFNDSGDYEKGFKLDKLFLNFARGLTTERDNVTIHFDEINLKNILTDLESLDIEVFRLKHTPKPDGRDWKITFAKNDLAINKGNITDIAYRPFDTRKTYYTGKSKGFMAYPRNGVMQHFTIGDNLGLVVNKPAQGGSNEFNSTFITKTITDQSIFSAMKNSPHICPLYLYPETNGQQSIDIEATRGLNPLPEGEDKSTREHAPLSLKRVPNLNIEIVQQIADKLGLTFVPERHCEKLRGTKQSNPINTTKDCFVPRSKSDDDTFAPIDILDYIYAVLHSPTYREKYKEFLKIDFPRVPYPKDQDTFWQLVKLGGEIRQIHLLESPVVEKYITQYPIDGNNVVTKPRLVIANDSEAISTNETASSVAMTGRVYINETQYFDNVPQVAWEFYIGGYQPAQKWLKDRKERTLEFDDILHYQKIIVALTETDRLMKEIDKIEVE